MRGLWGRGAPSDHDVESGRGAPRRDTTGVKGLLRHDTEACGDVLWQAEPPRVLMYDPRATHAYGWVPFLLVRNVRATVLADPALHLQTAALCGWAAIIHATGGLGVPHEAQRNFTLLFSTLFLGATANLSTIVALVLGLFVTLVVSRWWDLRTTYASLLNASVEFAMLCAHAVGSSSGAPEGAVPSPAAVRLRTLLIRYVNLAHVLLLCDASGRNAALATTDGRSSIVARSKSVRSTLETWWRDVGRRSLERHQRGAATTSATQRHSMSEVGFQHLHAEGLVTNAEWERLCEGGNANGIPKWLLVTFWVERIVHEADDNGLVAPGARAALLQHASALRAASSKIMTLLTAQLPYTYIQLVSFVVHVYLVVLATWWGFLQAGGMDEEIEYELTLGRGIVGEESAAVAQKEAHSFKGDYLTPIFGYLFVAFSNVLFQGLLAIHALLDNPFGAGPVKFPLRAHTEYLAAVTRGFIRPSSITAVPCIAELFGGGEGPR